MKDSAVNLMMKEKTNSKRPFVNYYKCMRVSLRDVFSNATNVFIELMNGFDYIYEIRQIFPSPRILSTVISLYWYECIMELNGVWYKLTSFNVLVLTLLTQRETIVCNLWNSFLESRVSCIFHDYVQNIVYENAVSFLEEMKWIVKHPNRVLLHLFYCLHSWNAMTTYSISSCALSSILDRFSPTWWCCCFCTHQ